MRLKYKDGHETHYASGGGGGGGGGTLGVPNTAIPYEKMTNTEIPRRKSTKYRYRIF